MLLIVKRRILSILPRHLFKSEVVFCLSCTTFQRTLVTNNSLLYNSLKKPFEKSDEHNYFESFNHSENYGKVVDLGVDFDDLKIDEAVKKKRRGRKKIHNLNEHDSDSATKTEVVYNDMNEDINLTEKNDLHKSDNSSVAKLPYITLKERSKIFSSIIMKLRSRKLKEKNQEIILEGKRLIQDAVSAGFLPSKIFFSRVSDVEKLGLPNNVKFYQVPYKSVKFWSDVVTPQGIIGIFKMPKLNEVKNSANSIPLTVICDNIRDPGNLGCILRLSAAVGCEKIILTKGCVDLWNSKVLRSSAGAHFRLNISNNLQWSEIESKISESSRVVLADFNDNIAQYETSENKNVLLSGTGPKRPSEICKNVPVNCYNAVKYGNENTVVIIGGESHGLSDAAYEFAEKRKGIRVFIPMHNNVESLNSSVALGIITYEFKRQLDLLCSTESRLETAEPNHSEKKIS